MRLVADSGLWRTDVLVEPTPLVAVLEVGGAVLTWTVDDPSGAAATQITFTDLDRADWLWRVLGESGHVAVSSAVHGRAAVDPQTVELAGVDLVPGSVDRLRRLAIGNWMRRWWPASERDGIAGLDRALLDAEIALSTAAAQDFFTEDTLDSDVAQLLAPHAGALLTLVGGRDSRIVGLARACAELADEVGVGTLGWSELSAALEDSRSVPLVGQTAPAVGSRDEYALAAGPAAVSMPRGVIAQGHASVAWGGVPPGIFDAAENTVDWRIEADGSEAVAVVQAAVIRPGPATGVTVRLSAGSVSGTGVLDAAGRATVQLFDATEAMTESAAWNHDWRGMSATIGVRVGETRQTRERVRRFARSRLRDPASDAFLAELVAAEADY